MPIATSHQTPADQDLGRRVQNAIARLGYRQHSAVQCESDGSTVRLRGRLSSFYLTQIAQTIAMKVPGVRQVVNEIEVCEEPRQADHETSCASIQTEYVG